MGMLRLASSGVVRRALRAIASPRILPGFIANAFGGSTDQKHSLVKSGITPNRISQTDFKKLVDCILVKVLKSEIKSQQLSLEKYKPAHFPFTIQDEPWRKYSVKLIGEFEGEKIDVIVYMPLFIPKDYEEERYLNISYNENNDNGGADDSSSSDSDSDEEKENSGAGPATTLRLLVTISKKNGKEFFFFDRRSGKKLEIDVSASADEIKIKSVSVKEPADLYSRPTTYIVDPDGDLQLTLREFLKIRGIKKSTAGFLYRYMVRKSKQQPTIVLKDLKKFIKE